MRTLTKLFRRRRMSPRNLSAWQIATLEPRLLLAADVGAELSLAIDLRGHTGQELVEIWAGDYSAGTRQLSTQWQRFDLNIQNAGLSGKDIRIEFLNDFYNPDVFDRNVEVGRLFLNGQEINASGEDIYSTATWLPEDGLVAGVGRGSWLHANGYLQFGTPDGSRLTVYARGDEGGEQLQVLAGSHIFQPTTVTTELQGYEFLLNENIDPGSVQIQFINDVYQPENGIDFNLTVDRIEIDGVSFETEATDVFQSGVFRDGSLQSGFLQSETLHGTGWIQFNNTPQNSPQYVFDANVSSDGLIDFSAGHFIRATSFSDGSFVGATRVFGANPSDPFAAMAEVYDASGNIDSQFNGGQGLNLLTIVENRLPESFDAPVVQVLDVFTDSQNRILMPMSVFARNNDGTSLRQTWVLRLTRGGEVDASFGDQGVYRFATELPLRNERFDVDSLDRLLATDGTNIVRLNNVGQLDDTFGSGGVIAFAPTSGDTRSAQIMSRADRSIVVLLSRAYATEGDTGYVLQFNEDGTVGEWFGDSGVMAIPRPGFSSVAFFAEQYDEITLDAENRLYLTGDRSVLRLTESGQVDNSYATRGLAILPNDLLSDGTYFQFGIESGAVIDSQGRAVLANNDGFIRLDAFGQLDTAFSGDGYAATVDLGALQSFEISDLQMDSTGRLFSPIRTPGYPAIAVWTLV